MDAKDRRLFDETIRHLEIRGQDYQASSLQHIQGLVAQITDLINRINKLEQWKASQTASGLRNVVIGGAFVLIAGIIVTFLAFYLRL